jgi:hypothetical protein
MTGETAVCEFCNETYDTAHADYTYEDTECCPACGKARRDEMAMCDHRLKAVETDDGPGLDCIRCACQILAEDAERFLGPDRYALFHAGGLRAESAGQPAAECGSPGVCTCAGMLRCPKCGYTAHDAAHHMDHHLCDGEIPAMPVAEGRAE